MSRSRISTGTSSDIDGRRIAWGQSGSRLQYQGSDHIEGTNSHSNSSHMLLKMSSATRVERSVVCRATPPVPGAHLAFATCPFPSKG